MQIFVSDNNEWRRRRVLMTRQKQVSFLFFRIHRCNNKLTSCHSVVPKLMFLDVNLFYGTNNASQINLHIKLGERILNVVVG